MAGLDSGAERARSDFSRLHELRDRLRMLSLPGIALDELSMGMSAHFEQAIEAGATLVRIGSCVIRRS